jgi:phytoene dehydrogenase-like protein
VLESQAEPGGAVRTAEVTLPGFRHDLYATNLNGFAGSPFVRDFGGELQRHGLQFVRASKPFCSVFPDGDLVGVTTNLDETLSNLRCLSPNDADAWRALTERYRRVGDHLTALMRERMPSWGLAQALWRGTRELGSRWPLEIVDLMLQSQRRFVTGYFEHPKTRALWAAWGMHLDFAPDVLGGALYGFIQCMSAQTRGLNFGKGGARTMIDALAGLFQECKGELRCSTTVSEVIVEGGRAAGVTLAGGERVIARSAVIANLTPTVMFGRLIHKGISGRVHRKAARFRYGPGTMMIHLALSGLPDWRDERAREFAYIHVAPSLEAMSRTYRAALRGQLPEEPALVVAQPTVIDPCRAPPGKHVLSIQVRVLPPVMDWDAIKETYADRLLELLEGYAPGLRRKILGRCVLSPADLERANPNLVGGDSLSGSHHLGQQFIFRPFLGWSRYSTPVRRLYLCGASTWPGAGVGAISGYLLGHLLVDKNR